MYIVILENIKNVHNDSNEPEIVMKELQNLIFQYHKSLCYPIKAFIRFIDIIPIIGKNEGYPKQNQ